ncbi:MAG: transglutaminase domain-containing protein, partial [Pyrinomonadaceae bacterium]|nr:transglutaminase domain-containing protein [Sphingobacteriaceae bacterium]
MIKILFSVLLLCIFHPNSYAQNTDVDTRAASISGANCASVDALGSFIKGNFTTDTDRIRAIYIWITHHINYDVALFLAREEEGSDSQPKPTVADILASRKGVCQGYSELFIELCNRVGIHATLVSGYTKK